MGYNTEFDGEFKLDRPLTAEHATYLNKFSETRRMQRATGSLTDLPPWQQLVGVTTLVEDLHDPIRQAVGLPVGSQGAYFVGGTGHAGQDRDGSIIDYNSPPQGQPGLWCQWVAEENEDGEYLSIVWNGAEKFYDYVEWLEYIIDHFLKPWSYNLNGEVRWFGEESDDLGLIQVINNDVVVKRGRIVYEDEE